jgi:hypothetical protein
MSKHTIVNAAKPVAIKRLADEVARIDTSAADEAERVHK